MALKEFYQKVATDPSLQKELMEAVGAAAEEEKTEAFLAFGKKYGVEATEEEVKEFFAAMQAEGELSDDELDAVAGGKVDGQMVGISVVTFGLGCAIGSIAMEVKADLCKESFMV